MKASTTSESTTFDEVKSLSEVRRTKLIDWLRVNYGLIVALLCSVFVFIELDPRLLLSNTTTTGGDTGAHFIVPFYVEHHVLNHFRLTGWSPQWYDGYPVLTFYFPLPSLVVALFNLAIPYDVAFKVVTALGSLTLPICTYALGRAAKLKEPYPSIMALGSLGYLFDRTYTIDGGNIASTLAGEFSFSLSLSLGVIFLAVVVRGLRSKGRVALASLLYALTALAHLLPAFFVAALALLYVLALRSRRELVRLGLVGVLGFALIAFWILPFASDIGYTTSMGWQKVTNYATSLAPSSLVPWILLALGGAVISIAKRIPLGIMFVIAGGISAFAFIVLPPGAVYNARMLPFWVFCVYMLAAIGVAGMVTTIPDLVAAARIGWRSATIGIDVEPESSPPSSQPSLGPMYRLVEGDPSRLFGEENALSRTPSRFSKRDIDHRRWVASVWALVFAMVITLVGVILPLSSLPSWFPLHPKASFIPSWVRWNYGGYEAKPGWPEYSRLMKEMSFVGGKYGCGRAMWEYNSEQNDFGTPMALMLLPYWTGGCIDSMEGLFFESSATTPYHFLNQSELSMQPSNAMEGLPYSGLNVSLGVKHLQLLGVRYFMSYSPQVKYFANHNKSLKLVGEVNAVSPHSSVSVNTRSWNIYLVRDSSLVTPVNFEPVVYKGLGSGSASWLRYSIPWYQNPSNWKVLRAQSGPSQWLSESPTAASVPQIATQGDVVSNIKVGNSAISFHVSRTNQPVLVKISYFPNWQVKGGEGPYRVTPNLMVVIPQSHNVTLVYGMSSSEMLGYVVTGATALAILVALFVRRRPATRFWT